VKAVGHGLGWRTPGLILTAALMGALPTACASVPPEPSAPPEASPATAGDPPPWSPPVTDRVRTGEASGATATGGIDQPRWVLLRFVRAVRDGDPVALERLLTDPVLSPRLRERPREFWIERLTQGPRHPSLDQDLPLEALVSVRHVEVLSVHQWGLRPAGVVETDLLVTFPLESMGRRLLSPLLLWRDHGQLIVRPGPEPRVLGL
jgi:hypothetical protein